MTNITPLRKTRKQQARCFPTRQQLRERSTREFIIPLAEWRLTDPAHRAAFTRGWDEIHRLINEQAA